MTSKAPGEFKNYEFCFTEHCVTITSYLQRLNYHLQLELYNFLVHSFHLAYFYIFFLENELLQLHGSLIYWKAVDHFSHQSEVTFLWCFLRSTILGGCLMRRILCCKQPMVRRTTSLQSTLT